MVVMVVINEERRERYERTKAEVGTEVPLLYTFFQITMTGGLHYCNKRTLTPTNDSHILFLQGEIFYRDHASVTKGFVSFR